MIKNITLKKPVKWIDHYCQKNDSGYKDHWFNMLVDGRCWKCEQVIMSMVKETYPEFVNGRTITEREANLPF